MERVLESRSRETRRQSRVGSDPQSFIEVSCNVPGVAENERPAVRGRRHCADEPALKFRPREFGEAPTSNNSVENSVWRLSVVETVSGEDTSEWSTLTRTVRVVGAVQSPNRA